MKRREEEHVLDHAPGLGEGFVGVAVDGADRKEGRCVAWRGGLEVWSPERAGRRNI
jgi:hypothetical protein